MLRASAAAEKAGVPSVSIVATPFMKQAAVIAKGLGMPNLSIAEYPGVPMTDSQEVVREKTAAHLVQQIVRGLAHLESVAEKAEPGIRDGVRAVVFRGTLAEVQDHFIAQQWSDGLPIIPPTLAAVSAFLRYTDRELEEVIGVLPPENRQATVWNVAVNGVMAGCRPEYMPILLAIVDAILDPEFHFEDAGATPGWEPLVILSGPLIEQLDFNCGAGVMRIGRQANSSIGRFLRLYIRNVAGSRILPTGSDKGSIAGSFHVVLAENESAVAELGWQPFSVDQGFAAGENVVTVQSVVSVSPPIYSGGFTAESHMEVIAEALGDETRLRCFGGHGNGRYFPLLLLGPAIAEVIVRSGWSKNDIRRYLYDRLKIRAGLSERYAWHAGLTSFSLEEKVRLGILEPRYASSADPNREVPVMIKPEWLGIVVSGDPGRNQSKAYINNHIHGQRVSRLVRLPRAWNELRRERRP
ncbi:MAG: hypothetical protein HY525_07620 [Betaproteobacteria bacterium]|nr:hypothetical protein [Betaproteobacteria bacterium]